MYDNREYILKTQSNKGRKPLNWDRFYQELTRYILQECNGTLPEKQDALIYYMKGWCQKNDVGNGSHGAIQPRVSSLYKALSQKVTN